MKENLLVAHSDCIAALTLAPRGEDALVPLHCLWVPRTERNCLLQNVGMSHRVIVHKLEKKDAHFLRNSRRFFRRAASLGLATTV